MDDSAGVVTVVDWGCPICGDEPSEDMAKGVKDLLEKEAEARGITEARIQGLICHRCLKLSSFYAKHGMFRLTIKDQCYFIGVEDN